MPMPKKDTPEYDAMIQKRAETRAANKDKKDKKKANKANKKKANAQRPDTTRLTSTSTPGTPAVTGDKVASDSFEGRVKLETATVLIRQALDLLAQVRPTASSSSLRR